jgi:hypothetical protein
VSSRAAREYTARRMSGTAVVSAVGRDVPDGVAITAVTPFGAYADFGALCRVRFVQERA